MKILDDIIQLPKPNMLIRASDQDFVLDNESRLNTIIIDFRGESTIDLLLTQPIPDILKNSFRQQLTPTASTIVEDLFAPVEIYLQGIDHDVGDFVLIIIKMLCKVANQDVFFLIINKLFLEKNCFHVVQVTVFPVNRI